MTDLHASSAVLDAEFDEAPILMSAPSEGFSPPPMLPPSPPPVPVPSPQVEEKLREVSALRSALTIAAAILAPRALLLVAMLGALGLTVPALIVSDWQHLLAAVSFDVLVFWPTAYLYLKG